MSNSILLLQITLHVLGTSNKYKLEPTLLHSIIKVETNYRNVKVVDRNNHGSYGVAQVQLALCQSFDRTCTAKKLMDVGYNIDISGQYLKYLQKRCKGKLRCVISTYSTGQTYKYNAQYVRKVMANYNRLQRVYK